MLAKAPANKSEAMFNNFLSMLLYAQNAPKKILLRQREVDLVILPLLRSHKDTMLKLFKTYSILHIETKNGMLQAFDWYQQYCC